MRKPSPREIKQLVQGHTAPSQLPEAECHLPTPSPGLPPPAAAAFSHWLCLAEDTGSQVAPREKIWKVA